MFFFLDSAAHYLKRPAAPRPRDLSRAGSSGLFKIWLLLLEFFRFDTSTQRLRTNPLSRPLAQLDEMRVFALLAAATCVPQALLWVAAVPIGVPVDFSASDILIWLPVGPNRTFVKADKIIISIADIPKEGGLFSKGWYPEQAGLKVQGDQLVNTTEPTGDWTLESDPSALQFDLEFGKYEEENEDDDNDDRDEADSSVGNQDDVEKEDGNNTVTALQTRKHHKHKHTWRPITEEDREKDRQKAEEKKEKKKAKRRKKKWYNKYDWWWHSMSSLAPPLGPMEYPQGRDYYDIGWKRLIFFKAPPKKLPHQCLPPDPYSAHMMHCFATDSDGRPKWNIRGESYDNLDPPGGQPGPPPHYKPTGPW